MSSVYAYTITRANSAPRAKLLLETLTAGRESADHPFHWHIHVNGTSLAQDVAESCLATKIVDSMVVSPANEGQHLECNRAAQVAIDQGYDYLLRVDDDVEWLTKRWLAKLVEASQKVGDGWVLSPLVRGLRWQPTQSQVIEFEGVPIRFIEGPVGGICRLIPTSVLRRKPYTSDVRLPMGGGDADGVGKWAMRQPIIPMAYCQHIRVRHAKSTNIQEVDDPQHFENHNLFQHLPYIPIE